MKKIIHVLIIEDNEDDALLEVDELMNGGFNIVFKRVETREAMKECLKERRWECIISDYSLPQFSGIEALEVLKNSGMDIPFILISGIVGEETAVSAMKAGAQDYIMKGNLKRLVPTFERELREAKIRRQKNEAEKTIRSERIMLRTLIDNLPNLIYIKDRNCRKILMNKADVEFIGYSNEEDVIGKTDLEIFPGEIGKQSYTDDLNIIKSGQSVINREEAFTDKYGKKHWLLTTKIPIYNDQGAVTGLVGLGQEITELKQTELSLIQSEKNLKQQNLEYQALNNEYLKINEELTNSLNYIGEINTELVKAKNKAEESDKLKSAFLANMSHEIRTPLNTILGFSSFLRDEDLPLEKTKYYVDIIESSGQQLLTIISDILDISKIEAGQINIVNAAVDINNLLDELYQQFVLQTETKNIDLRVYNNVPDKQSVITSTDKNRLKQILGNLLSNAIKFTQDGKIDFGFELKENSLEFFVEDSGIGISKEDQAIIFKPFRQVEDTMTRNFGGNGLGLSISKALVEKLGGTITLDSQPGIGSKFTFTIPYVQSSENEALKTTKKISTVKKSWDKHLILIAEDEIYNYSYIEEILFPTNIKMLHAWDGMEAVRLVREHPDISLVLMDIRMPVMDGYTATQIIKNIRPQLPVIAQTAYALGSENEGMLVSRFDNYIYKPIVDNHFIELISRYIN